MNEDQQTPVFPRPVRRLVRGFVLAYVLLSLALLSLAIAAVSRASINADAGRRQAEVADSVVQQVEAIRSKILACGLTFPAGNNGLGYRLAFPAPPASGLVADLQCPGAPAGQAGLWAGQDGIYAPQAPLGMSAWKYSHDAVSMRVAIEITSTTPYLTAGLAAAARRLGPQAVIAPNTEGTAPVLTVRLAG